MLRYLYINVIITKLFISLFEYFLYIQLCLSLDINRISEKSVKDYKILNIIYM